MVAIWSPILAKPAAWELVSMTSGEETTIRAMKIATKTTFPDLCRAIITNQIL